MFQTSFTKEVVFFGAGKAMAPAELICCFFESPPPGCPSGQPAIHPMAAQLGAWGEVPRAGALSEGHTGFSSVSTGG